jgi:hypothetical protein
VSPAGTPPDFDVFIVLEPPSHPAPTQAPAQQAPTVGQFNFNGALYQGIGIMRRYLPF